MVTLTAPKLAVTPPTEAMACALTATTGVPTAPASGSVGTPVVAAVSYTHLTLPTNREV